VPKTPEKQQEGPNYFQCEGASKASLEHKKPLSLLGFSSVPELALTGDIDQPVEPVHGPHHRASDLQSCYDAG